MENSLRIFLIILVLFTIYIVIRTIKVKKISMKYGMYWTIIFFVMLLLIIFPNILEFISNFLGFKDAPNLLFLISIFILFYIVFRIYANFSKLQDANKSLIQEISILKHELKKK